MSNEPTSQETNTPLVTTLTAEQAAQVSGGSLTLPVLRSGCPTCTSGHLTAFANLAALVNPAPMV